MINIAIVGCGTMGKIYADHISNMENLNLAAVYHHNESRGQAFAQKYNCTFYNDYRLMLESASIDTVLITLPTYLHLPFTIEAARCGKNVYCEKPAALNLAEAKQMIQVCKENDVRLFIAHVLRFFPEYAEVKKQVQEGQLGNIGVINTKRFNVHPPEKSWYLDRTKSGGVVLDLMIHDIDYVVWLMGDIRSVYATGKKHRDMEYVSATIRFENDAIANMEACWGYPGGFTAQIEVFMEEGLIRYQNKSSLGNQIEKIYKDRHPIEGVEVPETDSDSDPYLNQLSHYVSCIENGTPFIVTDEDICRSMQVSEMINKSLGKENSL